MSRLKKTSPILEQARQRLAGLKSINPAPAFGPNLTLAGYETDINAFSDQLDGYNEKLSALDQLQNELQTAEFVLRDQSLRILAAVRAQFGPDSNEYEQAGGTRRSDRKRAVRKSNKAPQPTA